ncbi:uncharacterized [Tachysurus ichikawai]
MKPSFALPQCCVVSSQRADTLSYGHETPISVKSFSPRGQKFTAAITAGLQVNPSIPQPDCTYCVLGD